MRELLYNFKENDIAIESSAGSLSYEALFDKVNKLSVWFKERQITSVCIYAQNSIDWIVVDLACQQSEVVFTPIPLFFTDEQFNNLVASVKPNVIFSDNILPFESDDASHNLTLIAYKIAQNDMAEFPIGTAKVTYTSGSTGQPKGVCLSKDNQYNVAISLVERIGLMKPRHLCLLPLPTLLENIAGIYSPFIAGGTVIVLSDNERGFQGSRLINPQQLLACISEQQPNSLILVPELLHVLILGVEQGWTPPKSLKFIAVGGSKVSNKLIVKARECLLPVFQGYGLSECGSVVSLCTPLHDKINSAGSLLPHLKANVKNGELVVTGNTFLGYLEDKNSWYPTSVQTGDIASIKENTIFINGRIKNILINSFGRNISPEWVESEILSTGYFQQAVVFGDGKPFCTAIIYSNIANSTHALLQNIIDQINDSLPDYAQIRAFVSLEKPLAFEKGLLTSNGRPKRAEIFTEFKSQIENAYLNTSIA
ncbi:AMP-binding protein [Colwellia polaris]|jgi:long-subunit acyl-CoA synthetase (AMP-forming)|uniref:AMP-binding protein n=1 Tax=Colwellia polaris TaxID=326537 RepID=UPI000A16E061|nr:AMP-binding protein [Colwellia polaris]|tara:strand:+ start:1263 stop:2708 length:1446 start_codon:yes stop_codon:yes gene_type:complete